MLSSVFCHYRFASSIILGLLLASCEGTEPVGIDTQSDRSTLSLSSESLVNVRDFGAIGSDQEDDSEAFAAAISALPATGGTVRIPPGTYLFHATPRSSVGRGIDLFRRSNVTLAGDGMSRTILRMAPGVFYNPGTNVILVERSSGITIQDLTIDGNRDHVTYGDEQSHGVDVHGSSNIRFQRVLFTGMHGDGVRLLGLLGTNPAWVDQIWIENCRFANNGRSGIGVQRAVRGVTILRNTFTGMWDQSIDMEPSGGLANIGPRGFEIRNNLFFDTNSLALTISGLSPQDPARNVIVTNNTFSGAGIFIFDARDVRIESNVIRSGWLWAPIEMRKGTERVRVAFNEIDSRSTQGPAIDLMFHNSRAPKEIDIVSNSIITTTEPGVHARDSESLKISGNKITGQGSFGLNIQDIHPDSPLSDFIVENNNIVGYQTGIRFMSEEDVMTNVCVRSNTFIDVDLSMLEEGPIIFRCGWS